MRATQVRPESAGLAVTVESSCGDVELPLRLIGEFNVDNVLTVLAVLLAWEIPLAAAAQALARVRPASGRMEMFGGRGLTPLAIVDYAHTPDALAKALQAARLHCAGELRVVFGCGGDRDAGKRPLMGRVAAELADDIVLTDDNPRSEDPRRIVADILAGITPHAPLTIEHDRALAIRVALERSAPDDVVLIAGKGHEDYQIVGDERRAFRDQAVVARRAREAAGMKRTLAEFARACGGRLHGADAAYSDVVTDSRTLAPRQLFVALRGELQRAATSSPPPRRRGAAGAVVETLQPVPLPQIVVAESQARAQRARRAPGARDFRRAAGGRRRQQRQDHRQGDDRGDSRQGRRLPGDARQSQQSHRRAADAAAADGPQHRFAVIEMGANRAGEVAAAGAARRAPRSASSPTPARSTSRASAASRGWRARKARWSRRSPRRRPR